MMSVFHAGREASKDAGAQDYDFESARHMDAAFSLMGHSKSHRRIVRTV